MEFDSMQSNANYIHEKDLENCKLMQSLGVKPNSTTIPNILFTMSIWELWNKPWASIKRTKDEIALVDIHATSRSMDKACELFGKMP